MREADAVQRPAVTEQDVLAGTSTGPDAQSPEEDVQDLPGRAEGPTA